MIVYELSIVAKDLEWFGNQARDVFTNQHIRIQLHSVNLFGKIYKIIRSITLQGMELEIYLQARKGITLAQR